MGTCNNPSSFYSTDPKHELRLVNEELASIEQELSQLLDRQQSLLVKKRSLEDSIRAQATAAGTSGGQVTNWDNTGSCLQVLN